MVSTPEVRLLRVAERQHSIFTRHQALRCGLTERQIDGRLARGLWIRLHRRVYNIAGAPLTFEGRALAAAFAGGAGALVSHDPAALLWQIEGTWASGMQLVVPNRKGLVIPGVVVHQTRVPAEGTKIGRIPVTTCMRTLIDLAPGLTDAALEDAIDDARRRRRITPEGMLTLVSAQRKPGRAGLKRVEEILQVRVGKPAPGSGKESALARLFVDAGLPPPVPQYKIRDADGKVIARPDFAYPDAKLAIEFDSYEHHGSRTKWEYGKDRDAAMAALGWRTIPVTDRKMRRLPDRVIEHIWRGLAAAWVAGSRQT